MFNTKVIGGGKPWDPGGGEELTGLWLGAKPNAL